MRFRHLLGLLALSLLPATLAAQAGCPAAGTAPALQPHAASQPSTLPREVRPADAASCHDPRRAQVRTRSALRGAGIGLLAGSVIGAGVGYAAWEEGDSGDWELFSREETALIGAVYLGGTGALLGGVIGYVSSGRRAEGPATPRAYAEGLRIAPAAGAQVRVEYTVAF